MSRFGVSRTMSTSNNPRWRLDTRSYPCKTRSTDHTKRPCWSRRHLRLPLASRSLTCTRSRNRLTLAILLGSPIVVIAMLTLLFPAGAFDVQDSSAQPAIQMLFWVSFSSFFFGVTYGLL